MNVLTSLCAGFGSCSTSALWLLALRVITRRPTLGFQVIFIFLFLGLVKFSKLFYLGLCEFLSRSIMGWHPLKKNGVSFINNNPMYQYDEDMTENYCAFKKCLLLIGSENYNEKILYSKTCLNFALISCSTSSYPTNLTFLHQVLFNTTVCQWYDFSTIKP